MVDPWPSLTALEPLIASANLPYPHAHHPLAGLAAYAMVAPTTAVVSSMVSAEIDTCVTGLICSQEDLAFRWHFTT